MDERYDVAAARHYAAFRPPLHAPLLAEALARAGAAGRAFGTGADVGCGTGYSAHALAAHSARVEAFGPSPEMLARAAPHARVVYRAGRAERLPLPAGSVDVVTYAGVLPYTDRLAAARERRVLDVMPEQLTHVVLSASHRLDALRRRTSEASATPLVADGYYAADRVG